MRKKRENGMAKESGMGDFPRKQFESVLLHSLRIMDQNREYLQMHLARTGDERTRQALEDMGQESIRLERTLREMMGLLEVEMNDKPSMKPVDLCWILMEAAQIAPEIEKQLGIRLTVDPQPVPALLCQGGCPGGRAAAVSSAFQRPAGRKPRRADQDPAHPGRRGSVPDRGGRRLRSAHR